MAFYDCLQRAVAAKEIDAAEAETLFSRFDGYRRARGGGPAADAEAKKMLADALAAEAATKKRQALLAALNVAEIDRNLGEWRTPKGAPDMAAAAERLFENFGDARFSSIEGRARYVEGEAHRRFENGLHEFRRSALLGDNLSVGSARFTFRKNQARLENVVREAYGAGTNDATARALFKEWRDTADWLRQQFNALGGTIPKMEGGWLPQNHDPLALMRATKAAWMDYIAPRLDWNRMRHPVTGSDILPDEQAGVLSDVYDAIVSRGWSQKDPQRKLNGKGALANQYTEGRFLHFRSARDYLDYMDQFGEGDPFAAMMGHINTMSRDIATLRVLGPNPAATLEYIIQKVRKDLEGKSPRAHDKAEGAERRLRALYDIVRGTADTPVNARWAGVLAGGRNLITSAVLGQAAISAISDVAFQQLAHKFNGMPETGIIRNYVKYLQTRPRREAVRAGLMLDAAAHTANRHARYVGALSGPQMTQWLADRTITWSGLGAFTQAGKHLFGMDMMAMLADRVKTPLRHLDKPVRDLLEHWGIDEAAWDTIRKSRPYRPQPDSAGLLRPADIADPELAAKWGEMLMMETEFAVPSFSVRGKAMLGATRPGTWEGEIVRSGLQFKSFSLALLALQGTRIAMSGGLTSARGAKYAAKLLILTTLWGGLAAQLKEIVNGRDPRKMDGKFWFAAALQGGGLGLYGDFLFSDLNRFGSGLPETLTGPVVERLNEARNFTLGNVAEALQGKDTHIGREFAGGLRSNMPGSTIWWLKLAGERQVFDRLNQLLDPEAQAAFSRRIRSRERTYGQRYWWQPGTGAPQRKPDLGAATGP